MIVYYINSNYLNKRKKKNIFDIKIYASQKIARQPGDFIKRKSLDFK